jgi:hypothetical protein
MSIATTESRDSVLALDRMEAAQDAFEQADAMREFCADQAGLVIAAIKAIHPAFFTTDTARAIVSALAGRIARSNWSHTDTAERAVQVLDELHDDLEGVL